MIKMLSIYVITPIHRFKDINCKMKGLNILISKIGELPAKRFLQLSQPQLKQDHQELLQHLNEKDWQKAADKAHYLKATANLYASDALLAYYALIIQKKEALQYDFSFFDTLNQELREVEKNIQIFLEKSNS